MPVSTDFVMDEGLTLLRRRPGREELSRRFARLFLEPMAGGQRPLHMLSTTPDVVREALDLHWKHYNVGLSFTDCTLIAHARRMDAVLLSFDGGFAGLVPVASAP